MLPFQLSKRWASSFAVLTDEQQKRVITKCQQAELTAGYLTLPRCFLTSMVKHAGFQCGRGHSVCHAAKADELTPELIACIESQLADLMTGLEELSMSCSTVTAGVSSRVVTSLILQMARAASTITMSFLCRKQLSRKS